LTTRYASRIVNGYGTTDQRECILGGVKGGVFVGEAVTSVGMSPFVGGDVWEGCDGGGGGSEGAGIGVGVMLFGGWGRNEA